MYLIIGGVIGLLLLVFVILPFLTWKDDGMSYKESMHAFFRKR